MNITDSGVILADKNLERTFFAIRKRLKILSWKRMRPSSFLVSNCVLKRNHWFLSLDISNRQLNEGFFIPAHPVWMVLVPYGLYLTFASYLCPLTCLPSFLPLAPLATFLGTNFNLLMGVISFVAASLHVTEAVEVAYLTTSVYRLNPPTVVLWIINVFLFGIFGFWSIAFPDIFYSVRDFYCSIPGALCFNV